MKCGRCAVVFIFNIHILGLEFLHTLSFQKRSIAFRLSFLVSGFLTYVNVLPITLFLSINFTQQTKTVYNYETHKGWLKNGESGRRITAHLYITVPNYSAAVGMHVMPGSRTACRNSKHTVLQLRTMQYTEILKDKFI
jgi:hypothetical protein